MKKINFSGGEPFFKDKLLGSLVEFCKQELKLESVTIVSNGSLIKEDWFKQYGKFLDIIAISCDSFDSQTLINIGRFQKGKDHLNQLRNIRKWCREYKVLFKLNTVVNS
jgi:radical S-adenosyl methionine domain-containing protein 2